LLTVNFEFVIFQWKAHLLLLQTLLSKAISLYLFQSSLILLTSFNRLTRLIFLFQKKNASNIWAHPQLNHLLSWILPKKNSRTILFLFKIGRIKLDKNKKILKSKILCRLLEILYNYLVQRTRRIVNQK